MENQGKTVTPKTLYYLGILCLIPLLGALVGLMLLVIGMVVYKDKWLIVIGAFGIIFTASIYSFLFYYMENGKQAKDAFASLSLMQLNGVVKNIEFYNLQYGHYPNNLEALQGQGELDMVSIYDPSQALSAGAETKYQYELKDEGYVLFSVGRDGIANTGDDVYPFLKIPEGSKVGLSDRPVNSNLTVIVVIPGFNYTHAFGGC